ncbi:hypothetical protein C1932_18275 [Stenotrophomonas sp. YAU14D1_LEIMI4_1]|nr:hypothetical protein C1932_18275 [Stenotrophomonas sp. YAU14D1_LEIMI4_1]
MPARATADYPALSARYADFFPGQPTATARSEAFRWAGGTLRLDRHGPRQAPLTVVLVHGAGGYGRMFAPLAAALADAGHEVLAPDLPGYGLSPAHWAQVDYAAWKRALLPTLRPLSQLTRGLRVPVRWFTHMQRMSRDPALTALVWRRSVGRRQPGAGRPAGLAVRHRPGTGTRTVPALPRTDAAPGLRRLDPGGRQRPLLPAPGRAQAARAAGRQRPLPGGTAGAGPATRCTAAVPTTY